MNTERIKEIQQGTAYSDSISVQSALFQVWNECQHTHINELEKRCQEAFRDMRKKYTNMTIDDIQILATFIDMLFKDNWNK